MAAAISDNWKAIVENTGEVFVTAKDVLGALHALNIAYTADGGQFTKPNALGDVLGKHALDIPFKTQGGSRHYFLPALGMEEEDLRVFQGMTDQEKAEKAQQIILDLKAGLSLPDLTSETADEDRDSTAA